jgi:trehalose 6-phosphate phosphatase
LFLDLDGTLIDLAPTPFAAASPSGLSSLIAQLTKNLEGALAILSGRTIAGIDQLLHPLHPLAAGVHGGEIRDREGDVARPAAPLLPASFVNAVKDLSICEPGVLIEAKGMAIAVHYRLAQHRGPEILRHLRELLRSSSAQLDIRPGKMVFEIVPKNISKGGALTTFMNLPAFAGREPIMIGDDATDLDAFSAAEGFGGKGLRVAGEFFMQEEADFSGTAAVRHWLAELAEQILAKQAGGDPCF